MRVYLFYVSHKPDASRQRVVLPDGGEVFIRVQRSEASDDVEALNDAQIRPDEQFMNSHGFDALGADIPDSHFPVTEAADGSTAEV